MNDMMKYCTTCGKPIRPGDAFCLGCGAPVPLAGVSYPSSQPIVIPPSASPQASPSMFQQDSAQCLYGPPPSNFDTESDMAETEVWHVQVEKNPSHADPFIVEVPRSELTHTAYAQLEPPETATGSGLFAVTAEDDDEADESPTIVAQPLFEDNDEDESPTIVVAQERYILVRNEDGQRSELSLPCILGRGKAADKKVKGNQSISRKHAKMFKEAEMVLIQDLGSTNGTFVDGSRLDGDRCVPVSDGSAVRLGTEDFTFHVESA